MKLNLICAVRKHMVCASSSITHLKIPAKVISVNLLAFVLSATNADPIARRRLLQAGKLQGCPAYPQDAIVGTEIANCFVNHCMVFYAPGWLAVRLAGMLRAPAGDS